MSGGIEEALKGECLGLEYKCGYCKFLAVCKHPITSKDILFCSKCDIIISDSILSTCKYHSKKEDFLFVFMDNTDGGNVIMNYNLKGQSNV